MYTGRGSSRDDKKEPLIKKKDVILIVDCLLLVFMSIFVNKAEKQSGQSSDLQAVVYIGEEEYARYPLDEESEQEILGPGGGTNLLKIHNGKADVTEASCPDKICVRQTPISEIGETIVCLPNQVIVTVEAAR